MSNIADDFMRDIAAVMRPVVDRYFGSADADRIALANLRARVATLFDAAETLTPTAIQTKPEAERVMPGTVKPVLRKLVAEHPGMTVNEIVSTTGFKFNTVRGTLWNLAKEGVVELVEGRYFPKSATPEG